MATYLLIWNPKQYPWDDLEYDIDSIRKGEKPRGNWSCGNTRKIQPGDRFFMIRLGLEPKGIVGSGMVVGNVYYDDHWDEERALAGDKTLYAPIVFDNLLNPDKETILPVERLEKAFPIYMWHPPRSGNSIPDDIAEGMERIWKEHLGKQSLFIPEEVTGVGGLYEGATEKIPVNSYERNAQARQICIKHYGTQCQVCETDLGEVYGEIGEGFIHVHHILPLSTIRQRYEVDPILHLRPVCPNCHAMLHRKEPPYTIEELKLIIKKVNRKM